MAENLQEITSSLIKKGRIPINGGIEILSKCNFKCVHCYNGDEPAKYMPLEFAIDLADQLEKMGTMHVYLTGGEALLHPKFEEIYKYFRKKGIIVSVLTNASLIDRHIKLFENYTPYNIDVSLYGVSNDTYEMVTGVKNGFDKVYNNIELMISKKLTFSLKTVVLRENIKELDKMIAFAKRINKRLNIYTDIRPLNNGNCVSKKHQLLIEQIIEIEKKIGKWNISKKNNKEREEERERRRAEGYLFFCEMGKYTFFITYDGMLHGCVKERKRGYDLKTMTFDEAFKRIERDIVLKKEINNKCQMCKYIKYCNYCPAQFELETGNILSPPKETCELAYRRYCTFENTV